MVSNVCWKGRFHILYQLQRLSSIQDKTAKTLMMNIAIRVTVLMRAKTRTRPIKNQKTFLKSFGNHAAPASPQRGRRGARPSMVMPKLWLAKHQVVTLYSSKKFCVGGLFPPKK